MKTTNLTSTPARDPAAAASHLALGLWMRGSIAGAAIALTGVASLLEQPPAVPALIALTWIAAGGTFSWLSWQRARAYLDRIEGDERADVAMAPHSASLVLTRQDA
jgi:hypothetical protein